MAEKWVQLSLDDELYKREARKARYGCVLRAAASLLKAKPTEDQWDKRLSRLTDSGLSMDLITLKRPPENREEALRWAQVWNQDRSWIKAFFDQLPASATPMGESIKRYDLRLAKLRTRAIRRKIRKGDQILVLSTNHLAHLGCIGGRRLVSLSDNLIPVSLVDNYYWCFIFHPKLDYPESKDRFANTWQQSHFPFNSKRWVLRNGSDILAACSRLAEAETSRSYIRLWYDKHSGSHPSN